jgi:hypothetical protein
MRNILKTVGTIVASVLLSVLVVTALVGNQSDGTLGRSGTAFPYGISSGRTISSTQATGTSTLDLLGARSCIEMVASNGSTTAFYATSSTSGLVQLASCGN